MCTSRKGVVPPIVLSLVTVALALAVTLANPTTAAASQARKRPAAPPAPAKPKPAFELKALSATRSEVKLSWAANAPKVAAFVVERQSGRIPFAEITKVTATEASDSKIDPYATYVYRVRVAEAQTFSNEVTVGPPPAGFNVAAGAPQDRHNDYGLQISLALDSNDDPIIAYVFDDPNKDSNRDDTQLFFLSWDRAQYRWKQPVLADTTGQIDNNTGQIQVSLARDASNNLLGIAYQKGEGIWLALSSDGGATWSTEAVLRGDNLEAAVPSLGMAGGTIHVAYFLHAEGVRYVTRVGASGRFESSLAPVLTNTIASRNQPPSLALDAEGKPGLAYWLQSEQSYNVTLAFWRPGTHTAFKVIDSSGFQNDTPAVSLAFHGSQPRVGVRIIRVKDGFDDDLWATASPDGQAWSEPVQVPRDGGHGWDNPISLAVDSKGRGALAVTSLHGVPAPKPPACGLPKLARSSDFEQWTTCSPDTNKTLSITAWHPSIVFAGNDKLYLAFRNNDSDSKVGVGVVLWREP